jgi:phosphatidylglycerophosphate synthase
MMPLMPEPALDRRPLASRDTRWANALAGFLARRGASPNGISVAGLVVGLLAGAAFFATSVTDGRPYRLCWLAGAACVQLRLLANLLDGMVAVASGKTSKLGELFNEFPDRLSDAAALIGLGYAAGGLSELGYLATVGALLTAYVRALGKAAGTANVFAGPMAKPHRMFLVTVTAVACAALPAEWTTGYHVPAWALGVVAAGTVVTVVRRLARIAAQLRESP